VPTPTPTLPDAATPATPTTPAATSATIPASTAEEGAPWRWSRVLGQIHELYVLLETDAG
jgi:hypothetical protein